MLMLYEKLNSSLKKFKEKENKRYLVISGIRLYASPFNLQNQKEFCDEFLFENFSNVVDKKKCLDQKIFDVIKQAWCKVYNKKKYKDMPLVFAILQEGKTKQDAIKLASGITEGHYETHIEMVEEGWGLEDAKMYGKTFVFEIDEFFNSSSLKKLYVEEAPEVNEDNIDYADEDEAEEDDY